MTDMVEIQLGASGIRHIESALKGGTGLCAILLSRNLDLSETYAPLPRGTKEARAHLFDVGGISTRSGTKAWLANHLLVGPDRPSTVIFQDIWARPSDATIQHSVAKSFCTREEVYYFASLDSASHTEICAAFDQIGSYQLVGISSGFSVERALAARLSSAEIVEGAASELHEIFVSAYDQEGLVVWRHPAR